MYPAAMKEALLGRAAPAISFQLFGPFKHEDYDVFLELLVSGLRFGFEVQ